MVILAITPSVHDFLYEAEDFHGARFSRSQAWSSGKEAASQGGELQADELPHRRVLPRANSVGADPAPLRFSHHNDPRHSHPSFSLGSSDFAFTRGC